MIIKIIRFSICLAFFVTVSFARLPIAKSEQALSHDMAFQILKELNDKEMLFPESLMGMRGKYLKLNPENCFGFEPTKGWMLVGESSGQNNYGITFEYVGEPVTVQIGFLYSNSDFLIVDKPMRAGSYAVLARIDIFQLSGDAETSHWVRGRRVVDQRIQQIKLANSLNASLFDSKSPEGPKFNFIQEGQETFIIIGDNKLPIRKK